MQGAYGFGKEVNQGFQQALESMTKALQGEGFGVLMDIDVAATLKQKLNVTLPPYHILGACNPATARDAIEAEPSIGLLLPCHVVVRQTQENKVFVECMDPMRQLRDIDSPVVSSLAQEARTKLQRALAKL